MSTFGPDSLRLLGTCDDRLQKLFKNVVEAVDCVVICGHRGETEQNDAYRLGRSRLKYPESQHNSEPAQAVDVVPGPVDWNDPPAFYYLAGFVLSAAKHMGIAIRWGGDWDGDGNFKDQSLHDLAHYELKND